MRFPHSRPPADQPITVNLDVSWRGVNEREEPGLLAGGDKPAFATRAVNVNFENGQPETRAGFVNPLAWNPSRITPYSTGWTGKFTGAGLYVNPQGEEWMLLARDYASNTRSIWHVRSGQHPRQSTPQWTLASYSSTFTPAVDGVTFTQAGVEMILWRRGGLEPLHWAGDFSEEWVPSSLAEVPADTPADLQPLPATAEFGIYMSGRVVFPLGSEIGWTGILDPRRWDAVLSRYSIGGDAGGVITALKEWRKGVMIIFKETSVWSLTGFTGDLGNTELIRVTDQAGCIAHGTVTSVGGDLIWLGEGAVHRLSEVQTDSIQLQRVPVSWPIPASMARINWQAARGQATAVLAGGRWHLCVPVDGSAINNAVFVLDVRTMEWQGEYTLPAYSSPKLHAAVTTTLWGRETPVLVTPSAVLGQGTGWHDGFGDGDIPTRLETRGYALDAAELKKFRGVMVDTLEHGTTGVTLTATLNGSTAVQTLVTPRTRRPQKYLSFPATDRDLTNPADNAQEPNREDYSIEVTHDGIRVGTGVRLDVMQSHRLTSRLSGTARWVKLAIASTAGRLRIAAVSADGFARAA